VPVDPIENHGHGCEHRRRLFDLPEAQRFVLVFVSDPYLLRRMLLGTGYEVRVMSEANMLSAPGMTPRKA
jgi:hypothetical protein